ncbi:GC-rich sequence DNA-binding factor 2 [Hondaea fermentalgiana]|uniref:GC-rich sequence DNA-binding factor 2 n=1 Tax=Hondaea fermentalgiana TaxID=2315210 RepID=A0A2R5GHK2_9STRA|nr:GC-rich sequence DNA-binding factor 2 [Hondaea fermentalgiana]|eukprot:GBG30376.1 GC-rich sequence DNA-binding factor 2 [Hondaea fermentalgiana]
MFKKRRRRRAEGASLAAQDLSAAGVGVGAGADSAAAAPAAPAAAATAALASSSNEGGVGDGGHERGDQDQEEDETIVLASRGRRKKERRQDADGAKTFVRPEKVKAHDDADIDDVDMKDGFDKTDPRLDPDIDAKVVGYSEDDQAWEDALMRRGGAMDPIAKQPAEPVVVEKPTLARRDIFASVHRLAQDARDESETATYRVTKRDEELAGMQEELEQHRGALEQACAQYDRRQQWRKFVEGLRECLKHKAPMVKQVLQSLGKLRRDRKRGRKFARHQAVADMLIVCETMNLENCGPRFPKRLLNSSARGPREVDELGRDISARRMRDVRDRVNNASSRWAATGGTNLISDEGDLVAIKARELRASQILKALGLVFEDVAAPFDSLAWVADVAKWRESNKADFDEASVSLAIPELVAPYLHACLVRWDPHTMSKAVPPASWAEAGPAFAWVDALSAIEGVVAASISRDLVPSLCTRMRNEWDACDTASSRHILRICELVTQTLAQEMDKSGVSRHVYALAQAAASTLTHCMDSLGVPLLSSSVFEDTTGYARQTCERQLELIVGVLRSSRVWMASDRSPLRARNEALRAVRASAGELEDRALRFLETHASEGWAALAQIRRHLDDLDNV